MKNKSPKTNKTPKESKTPINCRTIENIYEVLYSLLLKTQRRIDKNKTKPLNLKKLQEAVYSYVDNVVSYENLDTREHIAEIMFTSFVEELIDEIKEYKEETQETQGVTDGR